MSYETILAGVEAGVTTITLNRPEKLNPLSPTMLRELSDAFAAAEDDPAVRAIVLTGNGRAFSAGADLNQPAQRDLGALLESHYNPLILRLRAMPKPIVVGVNGICAGAACNLVLAGDIVLAARSARFIEVFARIGLLPDAGGTFFLPRAIGRPRATAASMLADDISAEQALAWGMIWAVADDGALAAETEAVARRLASGPTRAYAAIKKTAFAQDETELTRALALEAVLQRELGQTQDYAEGVASFQQKRAAAFQGR